MRNIIKFMLYPLVLIRRCLLRQQWCEAAHLFWADYRRYVRNSGAMEHFSEESSIARIIMAYHVIEKGLTMPNRRTSFGHDAMRNLMRLINRHTLIYGTDHPQVQHAIEVVKAYDEMHRADFPRLDDVAYWREIEGFLSRYEPVRVSSQLRMTRAEFFSKRTAPFPEFAASRHSLRHYEGTVDLETIREAVRLAQTAPSACNRQHTRVYCVTDHSLRDQIYSLQNGNRGFGHLADKLLVLTGELEDVRWLAERHDVYTNGGIFLMNLCYALHYHKVAHCILNCSLYIAEDKRLRKLLGISDSEVFIAMVCCGQAPASFAVAASPRREISEIFTVKDGSCHSDA